MPVIKVEYDDEVVSESDARAVCEAVQRLVIDATGIKEVYVWGNTAKIKIDVEPIEIWVEMSAYKVDDAKVLSTDIRDRINSWKKEVNFPHPINLTLNPVDWQLELGI